MRAGALAAACAGGLWTSVEVVASTGSTNADLLSRGGPEGQVLVAEEQTAGRGRMGRSWVSQPGAALTFSVLLRPADVPAARSGWLPLLAGVAVAGAVRAVTGLPAALKWPNDVLIGDRKLAGILAEQSGDYVVIGVGLNVTTRAEDLPAGAGGLRATSLAAEVASSAGGTSSAGGSLSAGGAPSDAGASPAGVDRESLLVEVLGRLENLYAAFRKNPDPVGNGLLAAYRDLCGTLGRSVRVELPAGRMLAGIAEDVDSEGRLLVREPGAPAPVSVSAGDVIHVRRLV